MNSPPSNPSGTSARERIPNPDAADDHALIDACLENDHAAWSALVRRYERLIYSIPRRYGFDTAASEDVFQEVCAALLESLGRIRNREGLPKWLITTAHRMCTQRLRKRTVPTLPELDPLMTADAPPEELSLQWERQHLVRLALDRLGGRCATLLRMLYLAPSSPRYEQIAEQLGVPIGSIGPTRARCLEKMLQILETLDRDQVL